MSFFGISSSAVRYGVIIDIGSGSVLAAIVRSDPAQPRPDLIWSHRENTPLSNNKSLENSAKVVMAALINAAMRLDAEGRKTLYDFDNKAVLSEMQCGVSAPWSYTVTKTVNLQQDEPFRVTMELLDDLSLAAEEKVVGELKGNPTLQELGLVLIDKTADDLLANGYKTKDPIGEEVQEVSLSHTSVLSQQYLLNAITELRDKLFQQATLRHTSFILIFFKIIEHFLAPARDICLIDITDEATEIAIVRDNLLTYATHSPFGHFSLAREISEVTGLPLHEAHAHLYDEVPRQFISNMPAAQKEAVEKVFDGYVDKISELFHETGDDLSIPKRIYLHTERHTENFYAELVEKAVRRSIKIKPDIKFVTSEIIKKAYEIEGLPQIKASSLDSALVLSAQFFHIFGKRQ